MESMRDRFSGRDRMGSDRGGRDRYERSERQERSEMGERVSRRSAGYEPDGAQINEIANVIEQSNSKQLEVFADCIDDVKDEVYASEKEIMKALDQIASSANTSSRSSRLQEPVAAQLDPASKEEILRAVAENTDLLLAIRDALEKKKEEQPEAVAEPAPAPVPEQGEEAQEQPADPLNAALTQYYNNMEEHVHKENVKCYRNVQAALSEQGTQIVEQSKKSLTLLKILAIISTVLGFVNIALLISYILGFIY